MVAHRLASVRFNDEKRSIPLQPRADGPYSCIFSLLLFASLSIRSWSWSSD